MFADELNAIAVRELLKDRHAPTTMSRSLREMFRDDEPVYKEHLQTPRGVTRFKSRWGDMKAKGKYD